ncbi:MAG: fatty acid hydroxylase [Adhaeribacter sp.]|jgi:beta-carotene 3-hydroxylase|nr:fatty acid hydroxylase [Adhaeribacter sp.]
MLANICIVVVTFMLMEGVAWFTHKYILHGFLWFLHRSHHVRHNHALERNDLFFMYYGVLAMLFFIYGSKNMDYRFWIGTGISLYGITYFLIHDIFIHRRIKIFKNTSNTYLKALNIGHKVHHKTTGRDGSEVFGMLWVPTKYFALARRKKDKNK